MSYGNKNPTIIQIDNQQLREEVNEKLAQTMHILGERLEGETNDNGRIERLFNKSIGGTCKIPSGTYYIYPLGVDKDHYGINFPSNINVIMEQDTILKCLPQSENQFTVFSIYDVENVTITGGQIIGERYEHEGTTGEHGMGINIYHSKNITIDNVTLKDHWGDCIYIGGRVLDGSKTTPTKILIKNCILDNSRRQGISATICDGVIIENCKITNINGTAPEYGIDIETNNPSLPCKNVIVKGCYFNGSAVGGFVIGSSAENITVENCIFDGNDVNINKSTDAKVINCSVINTSIKVRSSNGTLISNNMLTNAGVMITTSGDITRNTSITSNVFQNKNGSDSIYGVNLVGVDNGCFGLNISGNSFYGYVAETIYLYNYASDMTISNNLIKSDNVTRWVMLIRGYDTKVTGNKIMIEPSSPITINSVAEIRGVRGSFDNNTIILKDITPSEALLTCSTVTGETVGMAISNNVINDNASHIAIKLPSSGDTIYKVLYNDFRFTNQMFMNKSLHFVYGNISSSTVSQ